MISTAPANLAAHSTPAHHPQTVHTPTLTHKRTQSHASKPYSPANSIDTLVTSPLSGSEFNECHVALAALVRPVSNRQVARVQATSPSQLSARSSLKRTSRGTSEGTPSNPDANNESSVQSDFPSAVAKQPATSLTFADEVSRQGGDVCFEDARVLRSKNSARMATRLMNFKVAQQSSQKELWQAHGHQQSSKLPVSSPQQVDESVPVDTPGSALEQQLLQNSKRPFNPSLETTIRAQKARANLELHFDIMGLCQGFNICEQENLIPKNMAVYNPLETIRNRDAQKSVCPDFNQHSKVSKHKSHWDLEPSELIWDFSRRCQLYNSRHHPGSVSRHKSKDLSQQNLAAADIEQAFMKRNLNQISSKELTQKLSMLRENKATYAPQQTPVEPIVLRLKNPATKRGTGSTPNKHLHSAEPLKVDTTLARNPDSLHDSAQKPNSLSSDQNTSPSHDKSFKSISSGSAGTSATSAPSVNSSKQDKHSQAVSGAFKLLDSELKCVSLKLALKDMAAHTNKDPLLARYSEACELHTRRAKHLTSAYNAQLCCSFKTVVPRVSDQVRNTDEQIRTLVNTRLSTTSTRIDKLMVDSDRTINRMATTLNLEVKQLSERLDSLERCQDAIKFKKGLVCFGYSILEYMLRFVLWVVWGFVSILLGIKVSVLLVIKGLRWLIWI